MVHVSSGCIYAGDKGEDANGNKIGFTEDDVPNFSYDQPPCSFYSGSKALGEEVLSKFEKYILADLEFHLINLIQIVITYPRFKDTTKFITQLIQFHIVKNL